MTEPENKTMKASEVRREWSRVLNEVFKKDVRVVVEKSGIPVAGIISARDFQLFLWMDAARRERFKAIDEMREAFKDVPDEELEREINRAVMEAREELRKQRVQAGQ